MDEKIPPEGGCVIIRFASLRGDLRGRLKSLHRSDQIQSFFVKFWRARLVASAQKIICRHVISVCQLNNKFCRRFIRSRFVFVIGLLQHAEFFRDLRLCEFEVLSEPFQCFSDFHFSR